MAELTPKQQAVEAIKQAERFLLLASSPDGDAVSSMLALYAVLEKLGKKPYAIVPEVPPRSMSFLPWFSNLQHGNVIPRDFIINLACREALPGKLTYKKVDGDKLQIIVSPKEGKFEAKDIQAEQGAFPFDLAIVSDTASFEHLGDFYLRNRELFSQIPILNIDHHASNDFFGKINLVDPAASATTEILVGLIEALGSNLIDENVATCLLTGILSDTGSFQNANTTPKSLTVAAQMMGFGAHHAEIIKNLFKTHSRSSLKLWGRILLSFQFDPETKFVWSAVDFEDFQSCQAEPGDSSGIIDQLLVGLPGAEVYLLLTEKEKGKVNGSIRTKENVDAAAVARLFGGGGHTRAAGFEVAGSFSEVKDQVIQRIKQWRKGQVLSPYAEK